MLASHSCSLLVFFEKSPLGIKLGTRARAHRFGIQKRHCYQFLTELTLIKHRHTSRHHTFQHVHSGHVHGYSVTLDNQLFVDRKERNVRVSQADVHRICHQTLQYVDISFFSLLLYIHTRYNCDTEQTYSFWEETVYTPVILFQEYIKLCTKHCCFLQLYFYFSMLFQ